MPLLWGPAALFLYSFCNSWLAAGLGRESPAYFLADFAAYLILPLACVLLLARQGIMPANYGLHVPRDAEAMVHQGLGSVLLAVAFWALWFLGLRLGVSLPDAGLVPDVGGVPTLPTYLEGRGATVYGALTAGFSEELMYRGLPWLWFQRQFGRRRWGVAYVLLTTLLFSAVHWEQGIQGLLGSALVGVAAAFALLRFRQLFPLMLAHAALDLYLL